MNQPPSDLIIVGGGFAACSAVHLLARHAPFGWQILLMTGPDGPNRGLGYATNNGHLLLNASHANMSLSEDQPTEFSDWLTDRKLGEANCRFVPRQLYGLYLRDAWTKSLKIAQERGVQIHIINQKADKIVQLTEKIVIIRDAAGAQHIGLRALICEGPKQYGFDASDSPRVISPVWPNNLSRHTEMAGHVVIIGTGLSALDSAVTVLAAPDVTRVTMISSDGYLPLAQLPFSEPVPMFDLAQRTTGSPKAVFAHVRKQSAIHPWQNVMDGVRPFTNELWTSWTFHQRADVMRRLASIWSHHRNRAPQSVLDEIDVARRSGRLHIQCGRFTHYTSAADKVIAEVQGDAELISCDLLIDARGYQRITECADTLCGRALADGYFQCADVGYGVACTTLHRASAARQAPIHVVGAARFGDLLETTGAPEIRGQVRQSLDALMPTEEAYTDGKKASLNV